jgi:hypothetical protein
MNILPLGLVLIRFSLAHRVKRPNFSPFKFSTLWSNRAGKRCRASSAKGLKNYVVNYIIGCSSDPASLHRNRMVLTKINSVLVQIIKQDWPRHWQGFIPEIVKRLQDQRVARRQQHEHSDDAQRGGV